MSWFYHPVVIMTTMQTASTVYGLLAIGFYAGTLSMLGWRL
jgi:hypothetical protein